MSNGDTPPQAQALVGRQPIFNRDLQVAGYELLFRSGDGNQASFDDADFATSKVMVNAFMEIGIAHLVGDKPAFVNLPRGFVTGRYPIPCEPSQVVLEILEDMQYDEELDKGLRDLKSRGFVLALDDFVLDEANRAMLPFAQLIKVDVLGQDLDEIGAQIPALRENGAKLLAEKVESQEEFDKLLELGFEYFQGYFFSKPKIVAGRKLPANKLAVLELLAKLQDPDCDIDELDVVVSRDVALTYKLLKLINSAAFSLPRKIESIKQALVMLGLQKLRSWIIVIAVSNLDDKPSELLQLALQRARMCELLAEQLKLGDPQIYFTAGLFSTLDALMDSTMRDVLEPLPLDDRIADALLHGKGKAGEILTVVQGFETGNWSFVYVEGIDDAHLQQAFIDAVEWASDTRAQLAGG